MTKLSFEDVTRIQSIILSSYYPDDLVERYVDGIESVCEKAKAFDRIKEMIDDQQSEGEPDSEVLSKIRYEVSKVDNYKSME